MSLEPRVSPSGGRALVVADGDVPRREDLDAGWPGWDRDVRLVVAADAGVRHVARLGFRADLLVGDFDSLGEAGLEAQALSGAEVLRSPVAKDESDTELAVAEAAARGAHEILILGALGGPRLDHALANVALLAHPALARVPATLLDARTRVSLLRAPGPGGEPAVRQLRGRPGDLVSLLPLTDRVEGVTTSGLAYPLADEALTLGPARGLSNVRPGADACVTVRRGLLLIVETHQDGGAS